MRYVSSVDTLHSPGRLAPYYPGYEGVWVRIIQGWGSQSLWSEVSRVGILSRCGQNYPGLEFSVAVVCIIRGYQVVKGLIIRGLRIISHGYPGKRDPYSLDYPGMGIPTWGQGLGSEVTGVCNIHGRRDR